jgi:hypothetical protein
MENIKTIKKSSKINDSDTKNFCKGIMHEMLWAQPPQVIEKFCIKKQLKFHPEMKAVSNISEMEHREYDRMKET